MSKIVTVMGTRPEIIKLSPVIPLLEQHHNHILVHSGQHYSAELDTIFFRDLGLTAPNYSLGVGSGPHGAQTARILERLEPILLSEKPDLVLVQGDTNTTLAGGLCAAKIDIPVIHLEAGGRSFNRHMPEELNRILVDHLASLLLAADQVAEKHLLAEGLDPSIIKVIGSTAIDAVMRNRDYALQSNLLERLELQSKQYLALTLHRAENTIPEVLPGMLKALGELAQEQPIVFPIHPRTAAAIHQQNLTLPSSITVIEPLGYLDMLRLVADAKAILTDSGGLQEEAAALNTPALLLRNETEWAYLTDAGVNVLVGNSYEDITTNVRHWLVPQQFSKLQQAEAPLWAGASERTVQAIQQFLQG